MKYKRIVVTRHGPPSVLQAVEKELPEPQTGEVRVKILAAGVSAIDLMFRRSGALPGTPRGPFALGEDIVGVVVNYLTAHMAMHRTSGVRSGERIPLVDAARAHELLEGGGYAGKVVLVTDA